MRAELHPNLSPKASSVRMPWWTLVIALSVLGAVMGVNLRSTHSLIESRERERLLLLDKVIDANFVQLLGTTNRVMTSIRSDLPRLQALPDGPAQLAQRLEAVSGAMPGLRTLVIMDAQGRAIASNRAELVGQNYLTGERFQRARQGGDPVTLYVSPPFKTPLGNDALGVSKVMHDVQGRFSGVILAILDPDYFKTLLRSVLYTEDMRVTMIHGGGMIIARFPDPEALAGVDLSARTGALLGEHIQSGRSDNVFSAAVATTGDHRLSAFHTLQVDGLPVDGVLVVAASRSLAGVFASWRQDAWIQVGLFGLLALASALGLRLSQARQRAHDLALALQETERLRMEDALRQAERFHRAILDSVPAEIAVLDADGLILAVNASWRRFTLDNSLDARQPTPLTDVGTNYLAVCQASVDCSLDLDALGAREGILAVLSGRSPSFSAEYPCHAPTQQRWFSLSVSPLAPDGRGVVVTHTDITGRKLAEARLSLSEENLAITLQSIGDAVIATDTAGLVTRMNPSAERLTGWALADATGRPLGEVFQTIDAMTRAPLASPVDRVMQVGDAVTLAGETALIARDGREARIADSAAPIRHVDGPIVGVVLVFSDVTAAAAARQAQADQQRLLVEAQQLAQLGSWEVELPSGQASWSAQTYRNFGLAPGAAAPSADAFLALLHPDDRAAMQAWIEACLAGEQPGSLQYRAILPDGSVRVLQRKGRLVCDDTLRPLRLVGSSQDITEQQRQAQELDRHRHHLEDLVASRTADLATARAVADDANQAKSVFLTNMSHEIRTPMNAIIGLNHLLRRSGATPEQMARLNKVDIASRHLLAIVNDVLDLSKIEAGHLQLDSSDFHLGTVLDNVASIVAEAARAKGLRFEIEVDRAALPLWLHGDATRLRQALLNYAGNAVKFTEHGAVVVRAQRQPEVGGGRGDDILVRFSVQDTGVGIAAADLPRLFQPFEQVENSTTRNFGGTGLGLAINRRLAQLMGGEAGVDSTPGVGSTFWFTARLRHAQASEPNAAALARDRDTVHAEARLRQRYPGARLLLVEDNDINREVALEMLHGVGLVVDVAIDGLQAVARARASLYDLVLMDMQMPGMDGPAATRLIRRLPGWATRPILALTANVFGADRRACEAAGMDGFIAKPVDPGSLYAAVLKWLDLASAAPVSPAGDGVGENDDMAPPAPAEPQSPGAAAGLAAQATLARLGRLAALPGFDPARAQALMPGKTDKFLALLDRFVVLHADDMARFAAQLAAGDRSTAERTAHTLHGAAATMGASAVAVLAAELERRLRDHAIEPIAIDTLRPAMQGIDAGLRALAGALHLPAATAQGLAVPEPGLAG